MIIDLGDIRAVFELRVKGLQRPTVLWHVGPVEPQDRHAAQPAVATTSPPRRKAPPMAEIVLTADQQAPLSVSGVDSDGNPVQLTGTPVFSVDNTDVLTLTDNGDGTALVVTAGPTGSALVTVTDSETNGDEFIGSLSVDVVAGELKSIAITATVEPQGTDPNA